MTTQTRRQLIRAGTALSPLLLAEGCGPVATALFSSAPQTYVLTPKSTFPGDLPLVDWQLLVEEPVASAALDTARIALLRAPTELDYYANVVWSTRAPEMVQTLLVESFENSGKIVSIGREAIGLRADYVLKTELREFLAVYAEGYSEEDTRAPTVVVRLNAKLVQTPQRVIIAGRNFEHREPVPTNNVDPIIRAFDTALGEVMKNLVAWTLRDGQANWERRPDARHRGAPS